MIYVITFGLFILILFILTLKRKTEEDIPLNYYRYQSKNKPTVEELRKIKL